MKSLAAAMILGLALAALGGLTGQSSAAEPDTLRLSLPECEHMALEQGEEMKQAQEDYATARAAYVQARSQALPQLNLSTGYTRQIDSAFRRSTEGGFSPFEPDTLASLEARVRALEDALPTSGLAGLAGLFSSTSFGSKNTWTATLSLSQKVFEGSSIWNSIAASKHAMRAAELIHKDREAETTLQVREAYLDALLAERGVQIAEFALAQADNQLKRVSLRREVEDASEFELLQAQVQRDNLIPAVLQAQSIQEVAALELARLINLPAGTPMVLTTPMLDDAAVPVEPAFVDTTGLVALALEASGVTALEEVLEARKLAIGIAASGKWPSLVLFADYSRQAFPSDLLPAADDWLKDVRAGFVLNWNLFDGLRTRGLVQESKARTAQAKYSLQQTRELIGQGVRRSQWDLHRAAADLHARAQTVSLARRAYELASLRYDEGASDLLEVSDARIALQLAQMFEAQARHDTFVALARLERLTGRPLLSAAIPAEGNR